MKRHCCTYCTVPMHWHLINSHRRAERTFPCWYSTLQTNSLVLMWTNAIYMQAVQLLLHASWRSWETYHEEALLHKRLHWDGRRRSRKGCSIDSPYRALTPPLMPNTARRGWKQCNPVWNYGWQLLAAKCNFFALFPGQPCQRQSWAGFDDSHRF